MASMGGEARGRPLRVGLFLPIDEAALPAGPPRWGDLAAMATQAEALGVDSLWLPDHLLYRFPDAPPTGQWECWSVLAALAATTRRLALGTLVTATSFRNPALLAMMAATVDEISGGRLVLGVGAGYHAPEYAAFGYPYDHRASRFEEALTIIHGLLRHGRIDFVGRFYQARDCELRSRGPRLAGPPLIVGARGARLLRLTARLADGWNAWLAFGDGRAATIPPLRAAVDAACRAEGRDPATLARSVTVMVDPLGGQAAAFARVRPEIAPRPIAGPPEAIAAALRGLAAEGVAEAQIYLPTCTPEAIAALGPVLATLDQG
jgi:alkanesulfonate monooxygenase SsuD/methylene tetrahydromethanopterin reductase-like flavin-dependent oxidoreductase (luciferase family)